MKLNHQLEKYSDNINQSGIYFVMSQKLLYSFVNKVCKNYNKLSYLQRNKQFYNLQTTF